MTHKLLTFLKILGLCVSVVWFSAMIVLTAYYPTLLLINGGFTGNLLFFIWLGAMASSLVLISINALFSDSKKLISYMKKDNSNE